MDLEEEKRRGGLAEKLPKRFPSHTVRPDAVQAAATRLSCGFVEVEVVYRLVLTLEGESSAPRWFAGDSVGNSGLATSSTTTEAAGQLPWCIE
ncbi:hypothetical protein [Streptomyces sp. NPDC053431]|uniref:hypothetical protein n=1 Tax=Streptomyces sp. NPDC053431 TaxID=3365703 RepID=UPI0037CE5565